MRRAFRLLRWLRTRSALFAAAMLVVVVGLAVALFGGATLPLGAAGLATVATVLVALEGRTRTAAGQDRGSPVGRTWIAVFAIVVAAGEGRRMAEGYMELQRQRVCGSVAASQARHLPALAQGESRRFTCRIGSSPPAR